MTVKKKRKTPLNYFFYKGDLHKKLHINRGADTIMAWNYPKAEARQYSYTDVKKNGEKAFSTQQVGKMLNRAPRVVEREARSGNIRRPQSTYGLTEHRRRHAYYWSEKDVLELHAYYTTVHRGRPRNDGIVIPQKLPTVAELRAMMRQGTVYYVKDADGNFVPTWEAEKF